MECLYYILPCLKREQRNNSENRSNIYNDSDELSKLNQITSKKGNRNKNIYFFDSEVIEKLELKDTEHYAKVIDIYDADTITCILFFRDKPNIIKIRLSGIDTPEIKPLSGSENEIIKEKALAIIAKVVLSKIIYQNNNLIYIKTRGSEKYGRTLADLFLDKDSKISLNQILIDLKLADSYQGKTKEKQFSKNYLNIRDSNGIINTYENTDNTFVEIFEFINNIYPIKYKISNFLKL